MSVQGTGSAPGRPIRSGLEVGRHASTPGDLVQGLILWPLWMHLALRDVLRQHSGTLIGPAWSVLGQTAFILGIAYLFSGWMGASFVEFLPHIGYGFVFWSFMSRVMLETSGSFLHRAHMIREIPLPLSFHVYRAFWKDLIFLAFDLAVFTTVALAFGVRIFPFQPEFIAGLGLVIASCLGLGFLLATLCLMVRSLAPLIEMAMRFLFFFTPIIWTADALNVSPLIVDLNPFSLALTLTRDVLLGLQPTSDQWLVGQALAAACVIGGIAVFALTRRKLRMLAMEV